MSLFLVGVCDRIRLALWRDDMVLGSDQRGQKQRQFGGHWSLGENTVAHKGFL